ncbi:MAG: hypothetical protein HYX97_00655 [Chloroflexi bacterium]|nr:hypothetical protein [Chloroflexota bacterium]
MRQSDGGTIKVLDPKSPLAGIEVVIPAGALPRAAETVRLGVSRASLPAEFSSFAQKQPDLLFRLISLGEARGQDEAGASYHPIVFPLVSLLALPQRVGPVMELQPSGTTFSEPVTVRVPFQVLGVDSLIDGAVFPMRGTEGTDGSVAWELISDFEIDQAKKQLVFRTKHFSLFDVFRMAMDKANDSLGKEWQNLGKWSRTHLEEARRDFPNKSILSPLPSFAQAITCTERDPTGSTDPPGLLSLLSHLGGTLGRGNIQTGQEDALKEWMQGMSELSAAGIYAKAHQLNNGDVFKALLTAHNTLRGIIRPHAGQRELTPEARQLMAKTAPLRGDGDDEAGALYHFFGTAVYGFAWSHSMNLFEAKSPLQFDLARYLGPDLVVHVEERVISTDFWDNPREAVVDLAGMDLGKQLYRQVQGKTLFDLRNYRMDSSACARLLRELSNFAFFKNPGEAADVTLVGETLASGAYREGSPLTARSAVYDTTSQGTSPSFSVVVFLDGREVSRTLIQGLRPREFRFFTANLGAPQVGSHTLRVTINPERLPESDYSDNTRTVTFTVESPPKPTPTRTPTPTRIPTPIPTPTPVPAPNLIPSKFPGYSDILVVSNGTDQLNPTATLQAGTIYVYWGIVNSGSVNASGPFFVTLYLDGAQVHQYQYPPGENLRPGIALALGPITLRSVTSGQHTLRLIVDSSNTIAETNESDNVFTKTITVAGQPPTLTLAPSTAAPGAQVYASGAGFTPSSRIEIVLEGVVVARIGIGPGGNFGGLAFTVPRTLSIGPHQVLARDDSGKSATATLTVTAPAPPPPPSQTATVSITSASCSLVSSTPYSGAFTYAWECRFSGTASGPENTRILLDMQTSYTRNVVVDAGSWTVADQSSLPGISRRNIFRGPGQSATTTWAVTYRIERWGPGGCAAQWMFAFSGSDPHVTARIVEGGSGQARAALSPPC